MDADISVLTSVAIDHVDWLGDNRESIGYEKAGIFRHGGTAICGDRDPPESVVSEAKNKQCEFLLAGRDFKVINSGGSFESKVRLWFIIKEKELSKTINIPGPLVVQEDHYEKFISKHKETFVKNERAYAIEQRKYVLAKNLVNDLIKSDLFKTRYNSAKIQSIK